jgi:hypothetical protein
MFRGRRCCSCDAEWLPVYERLLLARKSIRRNIDIYQLIGNASKSAGFHCCGGNADIRQASEQDIRDARNGGAAASRRDGRDGMIIHDHLVLVGCPHASSGSKGQIREINAGGDGLVGSKRDRGPRDGVHWPLRHYKDGIKWMKAEIARLEGEDGPIDDWKAEVQTYKVVKETTGYKKMWSETYPDTVRKPGYIIKSVGRSTKAPIGVMTENGVWYAQPDLVKVPGGEHNPMDPNGYKIGITGNQVFWLDQRLLLWGIQITPTRTYTQADVDAVKEFQRKYKLYVDGIPGPKTLGALAKDPS